ncbi:death ligand signal enhancer isoform X2 [Rhineura floridana]|uniref:death ligand signal enhancer isoform X2 n=1 Tax=Rhineura floridana TaxID=261503 RepID=UPI002AC85828|nr:death ligand signal enhancer isoform X2 [Rhineura floridana]
MLWRLLWSLSRGVRPPAGGGGAAGGGLSRHRPVHPVRPCEGEPVPLGQESTQTDGSWHGRHQQHKGCGCRNLLHHYMPLDAFTLSALAVLALELVKQVRWLSSLQAGGRDVGFCQLEGHRAVLPQHQHSAPSACSSGEEKQHFFVGEDSGYALKGTSPSKTLQPKQYQFLSDTGDVLFPLSTGAEPDSCLLHLQGNPEEESVSEAASQVQRVFQASISMASNILGLEKMRNGQCKTAFSCFKLAADQNYSKAQFNVGLCYEHGRGTKRNVAKAVLYYQRAAHQGHTMAQYRYAKCLLHHCPRADSDYMQEAVGLLDQAATAGLAQAILADTIQEEGRQHLQLHLLWMGWLSLWGQQAMFSLHLTAVRSSLSFIVSCFTATSSHHRLLHLSMRQWRIFKSMCFTLQLK